MTAQRAGTKPPAKPCFDCLDEAIAAERPILRASNETAFWLIAYVFAAVMLGTTLPTPLYVIYQMQWHFSSAVITLIYAVYAAGVLVALVFAGRVSDQVGRRPVLAAVLALSTLSTVVFIIASSVGWLFVGRVLSGFSAGLMTGTGTAALTEMLVRQSRAGHRSSPRSSIRAVSASVRSLPACSHSSRRTRQFSSSKCTWSCWRSERLPWLRYPRRFLNVSGCPFASSASACRPRGDASSSQLGSPDSLHSVCSGSSARWHQRFSATSYMKTAMPSRAQWYSWCSVSRW